MMRLAWKRDSIRFCVAAAAVITAAVAGALFFPPVALAWGPGWDEQRGNADQVANGPSGDDPSGNPNGLAAHPNPAAPTTLINPAPTLNVTVGSDGVLTVSNDSTVPDRRDAPDPTLPA